MISHLNSLILPGLIVACQNTHRPPSTHTTVPIQYICVTRSLHAPAATGKSYKTAEVSNTVIVKTFYINPQTITGAWAVAGMGDQSWPNICPAFLVYSSREIVLTPSWTWGRAAEEYGCCMPSIYIEEGPWSYLWPVRSCRAGIGVLEGMEGIQGMV